MSNDAVLTLEPTTISGNHRIKIETKVTSWYEWPDVSQLWGHLVDQTRASFFLTNEWVETWLEIFGEVLDPKILTFFDKRLPVGACILTSNIFRYRFLPMRRIYLNCAGEPEEDGTCIEYNRLLCLPGYESSIADAIRVYLSHSRWDELYLAGMELQNHQSAFAADGYGLQIAQHPCWYVDLAGLRDRGLSYEDILTANARSQIRRSIRLYEQTGDDVTLERAQNQSAALHFFAELSRLHLVAWTRRGEHTALASQRFHQRLISRAHPLGRIDLLRVSAGQAVIGILYNFLYMGRVYFYQSGFAYEEDNRLKPGLTTHYKAISYYSTHPEVAEYDFLAGDSQYKRSLAKERRELEWVTMQRHTLRVALLEFLRGLKN